MRVSPAAAPDTDVLFLSGAKVNATRLHETPLHHAAKNMRVEMIEILVEFGANIHARDQQDRKPVDYTTPGSPSAACLQFYESEWLQTARKIHFFIQITVGCAHCHL